MLLPFSIHSYYSTKLTYIIVIISQVCLPFGIIIQSSCMKETEDRLTSETDKKVCKLMLTEKKGISLL